MDYKDGFPFQDGLAAEISGSKYGFIDTSGEMVIEPKFDHVVFPGFNSGLANVMIDSISGYIDKSGRFVWSCENHCLKNIQS